MVIASNKSLAEYNLSRAEEFKEKKSQLTNVYEELKEINSSIEAKIAKISMIPCICLLRFLFTYRIFMALLSS